MFKKIEGVEIAPEERITLGSYWTAERLRKASPIPLINRSIDRSLSAKSVVDTAEVKDFTNFPQVVVGKLFMKFPTGDFVGSAWVVGNKAIATAGHCLFDLSLGGWATNVVFHLHYNRGQNQGVFRVAGRASVREWVASEGKDLQFDLGLCLLDSEIGKITGRPAIAIDRDPGDLSPITGLGYPADKEICLKSVGDYQKFSEYPKEKIIGMSSELTAGCSGGPWFTKISGKWAACGLNSFIISTNPKTMFSPVLGREFLRLIDWAKVNGGY